MKKLLLVSLLLCLVLCSCGKDKVETTDITTDVTPETVVTSAATTEVVTEEPIVTEITHDYGENVDAKYEVLTLDDEELNAIIEARSAEILRSYIPNISSINELGGTAEYNVKLSRIYKSDNIISAVFSGSYAIYYEKSEEDGEVLYTINVSPESGKILETPDIVDYEKMVKAFENGRFDECPDFSRYDAAYNIYPYVSLEETEAGLRLGVYVTSGGMHGEVLGYYISPESAQDFLKIQLTAEE